MTRLDTPKPKDRRKVAVIGSGLAGLTTAYLLRQEGVEVWLIEKSDRLGFHSASVHIPVGNDTSRGNEDGVAERSGSTKLAGPQKRTLQAVAEEPSWAVDVPEKDEWVVDVPMRSFQGGYYPLLIALYHHLGLPLIPCDFTFSFSRLARSSPARCDSSSSDRKLDSDDTYTHQTYFLHSGSSGLAIPALPSAAFTSPLSFCRHTLRFLITAICYLLYALLCFLVYHSILSRSRPFAAYVASTSYRLNYPIPLLPLPSSRLGNAFRSFAHDIVLPLFSAVGTMSAVDVLEMPMGIMADYVHTTVGTTHWRLSADTGAREVARRLVKVVKDQGEGHALMGTEVRGLHAVPGGEGVKVVYAGGELQVDTVILATPAKVAEKLLGGLTKSMQANEGMAAASEMKRLEVARKALRAVRQTVCPVSSYDLPRWVLAQRELIKKETIVVTHRDTSILPSSPHDVKDIDLLQPLWPAASSSTSTTSDQREVPKRALAHSAATFPSEPTSLQEAYTSGTHLIRPPAHFASQAPVLQTTNPIGRIDTGHILAEARLERALPIHDPITLADLSIPADLTGTAPLVVVAGAYAYPGIPLLEGCVGSAVRATQAILRTGADADGATTGRKASSLAPTSIVDPGLRLGGVDWTTGLGGKWGRMWRARRSRIGEVF